MTLRVTFAGNTIFQSISVALQHSGLGCVAWLVDLGDWYTNVSGLDRRRVDKRITKRRRPNCLSSQKCGIRSRWRSFWISALFSSFLQNYIVLHNCRPFSDVPTVYYNKPKFHTFDVSSASSRAVRQARHSQNAWARQIERVVSIRDVTSQVEFGLYRTRCASL